MTKSLTWCVALLCLLACMGTTAAQQKPAADDSRKIQPVSEPDQPADEEVPLGQVVVEGETLFTVYDSVMSIPPEQRAQGIASRIIEAAQDSKVSPDDMRLKSRDGWAEIFAGDYGIMVLTDADAKAIGAQRDKLAAQYAQKISQAIERYRQGHSWGSILKGVLYSVLTTLAFCVVLWFTRRIRFLVRGWVERNIKAVGLVERKASWQTFLTYVRPLVLGLGAVLRWLVILGVTETYLSVTLGFFSTTRYISLTVTKWVLSQLETLAQTGLDYLPNLLVVAVIALIAYYASRFIHLMSSEIARGDLSVPGFYPDWAEPTAKLIRVLVLILALIVSFPYLPGAKSPAFQGISIFLGVLLSLGSSSAVANAIAGVILTYMRSFLVGDWVEISGTTGQVVEKNLLVTRVLTPKNEVITIPNASVMSGAVRNYSIAAREKGVIFHTTVTIGYDAPWRTVHQLLIDAALATEHILREPSPFVLQSALNDFYVSYELNAYTDTPQEMLIIQSGLHKNIQDQFNDAGVEICSPHFSSLRDGNTIAIPQKYIKPEYEAPSFRLETVKTAQDVPRTQVESDKLQKTAS